MNERLDWIPRAEDIDDADFLPVAQTYIDNFGGIGKALYKANIISKKEIHKKSRMINISKREMLLRLIKLARELKKVPNIYDVNDCPYTHSTNNYQYKFGGLKKALIKTGVYYNRVKDDFLQEGESPYIF